MIVKHVGYDPRFLSLFEKLPIYIQKRAVQKTDLFVQNPLHPSLRLHQLQGKLSGVWSIFINRSYRMIFTRKENGDIVFVSIGKHDIYKYL